MAPSANEHDKSRDEGTAGFGAPANSDGDESRNAGEIAPTQERSKPPLSSVTQGRIATSPSTTEDDCSRADGQAVPHSTNLSGDSGKVHESLGTGTACSKEAAEDAYQAIPGVQPSCEGKGEMPESVSQSTQPSVKATRLRQFCAAPNLNLDHLRDLVWSGLPAGTPFAERALAWQLLLGYVPTEASQRSQVRASKRRRYFDNTLTYFGSLLDFNANWTPISSPSAPDDSSNQGSSSTLRTEPSVSVEDSPETLAADSVFPPPSATALRVSTGTLKVDWVQLRQIRTDLTRTAPNGYAKIFRDRRVQFMLTRCLYLLAINNPAAGYVQGLNDILIPFFIVFLLGHEDRTSAEQQAEMIDNPAGIPNAVLLAAEADAYAALQTVFSEVQDFYTPGQPGIVAELETLSRIVERVDAELYRHMQSEDLQISQFAFRWFNCLLTREFPASSVIQLWDTILSEGISNLRQWITFLCSAYLLNLAGDLRRRDFQEMVLFIQRPAYWDCERMRMLVAEAYVLKRLFAQSPNQLHSSAQPAHLP